MGQLGVILIAVSSAWAKRCLTLLRRANQQARLVRRGNRALPTPSSLIGAVTRLIASCAISRRSLQAKLAEEAERYDDMVQNVKSLAELNTQLNVEVRVCLVHLTRFTLYCSVQRRRCSAALRRRCRGNNLSTSHSAVYNPVRELSCRNETCFQLHTRTLWVPAVHLGAF